MLDNESVKSLRQARGLTLQQAADAAGFGHRAYWHQLEAGKVKDPRLSTALAVARVLGVPITEIIRSDKPRRR